MSQKTISMDGVTVVINNGGVEIIGIGGQKVIVPVQRPSSHSAPRPAPRPAAPAKPARPARPAPKRPAKAKAPPAAAMAKAVNRATEQAIAGLRGAKAGKPRPAPGKAKETPAAGQGGAVVASGSAEVST